MTDEIWIWTDSTKELFLKIVRCNNGLILFCLMSVKDED